MASGITIASLEWGDRTPNMFIDTAVRDTKLLEMFTLIDGVKSKKEVPIFNGALSFGTDVCVFDPQSTASIDEKEFTVDTYKWAFQNCKNTLQDTYRSVMLKNGANNPETMDAQFKDWLFGYFAKLAASKVFADAATQIVLEISTDSDVNKPTPWTGVATKSTILGLMEIAFTAMPDSQMEKLYGISDREFKPAFFLPVALYRLYQLAVAAAETTSYDGTELGLFKTYMGMEVHCWSTLTSSEMILTNPANMVMAVDDYADVRAIESTYKAELSSDFLWGQMTYGFGYFVSEDIVYYAQS